MNQNHLIETETIEAQPVTLEPAAQPAQLQNVLSVREQHLAIIEHHPVAPSPDAAALPIQHFSDSITRASKPHARNGKIARLPKLERDMVNRMLNNNIPHSKIVAALDELGIQVTERNVSNWKTRGGYKEWCEEQERQIQLSHIQDNLADHLRKNDAAQIPEVGLQVAATQLSSMLLNPDAVRQLATNPKHYSAVVDMLCRLSTQISTLQKDRDESVRVAAYDGTGASSMKRRDEEGVDSIRHTYSSTLGAGPRAHDTPHRNDLPQREKLYYKERPEPDLEKVREFLRKKKLASQASPANSSTKTA